MKKCYIYFPIISYMKLPLTKVLKFILRILLLVLLVFIVVLLIMTFSDYRPSEKEQLAISGSGQEIPPEKTEFTMISWNLGYFGLGSGMDFFYEGGQKVRPGRERYYEYERFGIEFLAGPGRADFILLQEVDRKSKRSYHQDQYEKIYDHLENYTSAFALNYKVPFVPVPLSEPMGKVKGGIAIFSLYRPAECFRGALPGHYALPKRLFLLDRCYMLSRFTLSSGKDLVIINTHNEAYDDGDMRNQQMKLLRSVMLEEYKNGNYVVAGGDWNMNPAGYNAGTFTNNDSSKTVDPIIDPRFFPMGWKWIFDPAVPTNRNVDQVYQRGTTPTTIIDYFIVSPNISYLEVETIDLEFKWSDHQPVKMKFKILE
jgi:endonuclease/exonuclease/phosphatase family metal-dependent hydrolase